MNTYILRIKTGPYGPMRNVRMKASSLFEVFVAGEELGLVLDIKEVGMDKYLVMTNRNCGRSYPFFDVMANSPHEAASAVSKANPDCVVIGIQSVGANSGDGVIKVLYSALISLRTSSNGHEQDFCGEMPHEPECEQALNAIKFAEEYFNASL